MRGGKSLESERGERRRGDKLVPGVCHKKENRLHSDTEKKDKGKKETIN